MTIVVTAAVIARGERYLVTRRQQGVHLEGLWEFPGGKCEHGESLADCLRRELQEELGAGAVVGDELLAVTHHYPERSVELHFLSCELTQDPAPLLGQEMRWVARHELRSLQFPPADDELIALLVSSEGLRPPDPPYTLSRSPLRRLAPFAWLARVARSLKRDER